MFKPCLSLVVLLVLLSGCRRDASSKMLDEEEVRRLGGLPLVRAAANQQLQEELARVIEVGGTPEQLVAEPVPDEENVWKGLEGLLMKQFRAKKAEESAAIFNALYPYRQLPLSEAALETAAEFRQPYDRKLDAVWAALARPMCDFGVDPRDGVFADVTFIDAMWMFARLEAFQAAEFLSLDKPEPAEAVQSLRHMLRMAGLLAVQKHLACRRQGALMRLDALHVLEVIAHHPKTQRNDLDEVYRALMAELSAWPADADVWIGDRALVLHSYEVIRRGDLDTLLDKDERESLADERLLGDLAKASGKLIDGDQLYYLQTMAKVIDLCGTPHRQRTAASYQARRKGFDQIYRDLAKRKVDQTTLIATELFLRELPPTMELLARERAAYEAWTLALAAALGHDHPGAIPQINPVSGQPYHVAIEDGVASAWRPGEGIGGAKRPARVPVPLK